ncbi:hypothetical protein AB2883_22525, partial [Escherichia coli]
TFKPDYLNGLVMHVEKGKVYLAGEFVNHYIFNLTASNGCHHCYRSPFKRNVFRVATCKS